MIIADYILRSVSLFMNLYLKKKARRKEGVYGETLVDL